MLKIVKNYVKGRHFNNSKKILIFRSLLLKNIKTLPCVRLTKIYLISSNMSNFENRKKVVNHSTLVSRGAKNAKNTPLTEVMDGRHGCSPQGIGNIFFTESEPASRNHPCYGCQDQPW